MLLKNEIKCGDFYAWDAQACEPPVGCNVFVVRDKLPNGNVVVESIDGHLVKEVDIAFLVTADRALKRLKALNNIEYNNLKDFQKDFFRKELNYLKRFKNALLPEKKDNTDAMKIKHCKFYVSTFGEIDVGTIFKNVDGLCIKVPLSVNSSSGDKYNVHYISKNASAYFPPDKKVLPFLEAEIIVDNYK